MFCGRFRGGGGGGGEGACGPLCPLGFVTGSVSNIIVI